MKKTRKYKKTRKILKGGLFFKKKKKPTDKGGPDRPRNQGGPDRPRNQGGPEGPPKRTFTQKIKDTFKKKPTDKPTDKPETSIYDPAKRTTAQKITDTFKRKDTTGKPNPHKEGTPEHINKKQDNEKVKQQEGHKKDRDDMDAKHKKEMDDEPDPVKREALKKKQDDEKAALNKKQDDERQALRKKHDDEQEDFKKKAKKDEGPPGGPPQMPGMVPPLMPGMPGYVGQNNYPVGPDGLPLGPDGLPMGPENYDPNGYVTPDGTGGRGTGPNGEDCVRISEDGICTLADGTMIMPDGSTILPDGTVIPPGGRNSSRGRNSSMGRNVGFQSSSSFSKANIQNAANLCRSVGIDSKILGNGEFVMNCPIEIDNNEYSGPKTPYQYKIPFEVDARSRFLVTQFMTHSPSSGFRYYKVYGRDPQEIEKSIQTFSKFQETINSPRGKFIGSLKEEISRLKSSLEKTQGELEDLENEFDGLESTYKESAADYIQLLQGKVASLSEQLAAAQRIRSKGMK